MNQKEIILSYVARKINTGAFTQVKMDEIAKENHISKKTIYNYFPTKNDLMEEALNVSFQKGKQNISKIRNSEGSAVDRILKVQITAYEMLKGLFPNQWKIIDNSFKNSECINPLRSFFHYFLFKNFQELIIEGIRNGELNYQIELRVVTKKIIFDLYGILEFGQKEVQEMGVEKMFYFHTGLMLKGLSK